MRVYKTRNNMFIVDLHGKQCYVKDIELKKVLTTAFYIPEPEIDFAIEDLIEKNNDFMSFGGMYNTFLFSDKLVH